MLFPEIVSRRRVTWLAVFVGVGVSCSSQPNSVEDVSTVSQAGTAADDCDNGTESLEAYAAKCDSAMGGVTIPQFSCDNGTELPGQGDPTVPYGQLGNTCDAPNVLNGKCDPHSRFQVLHRNVNNDGVFIVAHCRRKYASTGSYNDVAIIEYNAKDGSTCFFQALTGGSTANPLQAQVNPPSWGTQAYPWYTPAGAAAQNCVFCHDTGPFIRSPYLAQLGDVWPSDPNPSHDANNYLPGTLSADMAGTWNAGLWPYKFVGLDFQQWEAHSIAINSGSGSECKGCHRLGVGRAGTVFAPDTFGTALTFGMRATADMSDPAWHQSSKTPHSTTSPIWMTPGAVIYNSTNFAAATAVQTCAVALRSGQPLPAQCYSARVARGDTCVGPPIEVVVNGPIKAPSSVWSGVFEIPLGCKDSPGCKPGFLFWTSVHGPFTQRSASNIPIGDPNFFGSYLRLEGIDHSWVLQGGVSAMDQYNGSMQGPGAPGDARRHRVFPDPLHSLSRLVCECASPDLRHYWNDAND